MSRNLVISERIMSPESFVQLSDIELHGLLAGSKRSSILGMLAEVGKIADERHTLTGCFGKSRRLEVYGGVWFSK